VQILSNALPGFRDLRGPIIAGYMWLVFAWVIVSPDVGVRPDGRVSGALYDLADHAGSVWVAVAVSVVAYLLGAVSREAGRVVGQYWLGKAFYIDFAGFSLELDEARVEAEELTRLMPESLSTEDAAAPARAPVRRSRRRPRRLRRLLAWIDPLTRSDAITFSINSDRLDSGEPTHEGLRAGWYKARSTLEEQRGQLGSQEYERLELELRERANRADSEAGRELELPSTLLVGDRPELFAEVDRLRAEGDLRMTVVLPLVALTILFAVLQSPFFLLALVPIYGLLVQGIRNTAEARKTIADAITYGRVPSPSVKKFDAWVETLPAMTTQRSGSHGLP